MKHAASSLMLLAALLAACESKPAEPSPEARTAAGPAPTAPIEVPLPATPPTPAPAEALPTPTPMADAKLFRGLWVTRYDFRTPADVRRIVTDAAALGTTDLVWQARGQADAFYESALEPWGRELFRDLAPGATMPGFDPLKLAVDLAHGRGMRVHAWVNVMPLWKGTSPPTDPRHPFVAHPNWRLHDERGQPQALNEHYVIANTMLGEVQDHIIAVMRDIVTRYPVDGIHLDYIRFVSEKMEGGGVLLPADPTTLSMFRANTGRSGLATSEDKAAFQAWKRARITALVKRIREEAVSVRTGVALTAAVWRRPDLARDQYLQDSAQWLNEAWLDRAVPMIYTDKDAQFDDDLHAWLKACPGREVTPGIGTYMHAIGQTPRQMHTAATLTRPSDYCLFSYAAMFETVDPTQRKDDQSVAERAQRRVSVEEYVHSLTEAR